MHIWCTKSETFRGGCCKNQFGLGLCSCCHFFLCLGNWKSCISPLGTQKSSHFCQFLGQWRCSSGFAGWDLEIQSQKRMEGISIVFIAFRWPKELQEFNALHSGTVNLHQHSAAVCRYSGSDDCKNTRNVFRIHNVYVNSLICYDLFICRNSFSCEKLFWRFEKSWNEWNTRIFWATWGADRNMPSHHRRWMSGKTQPGLNFEGIIKLPYTPYTQNHTCRSS